MQDGNTSDRKRKRRRKRRTEGNKRGKAYMQN